MGKKSKEGRGSSPKPTERDLARKLIGGKMSSARRGKKRRLAPGRVSTTRKKTLNKKKRKGGREKMIYEKQTRGLFTTDGKNRSGGRIPSARGKRGS